MPTPRPRDRQAPPGEHKREAAPDWARSRRCLSPGSQLAVFERDGYRGNALDYSTPLQLMLSSSCCRMLIHQGGTLVRPSRPRAIALHP